jgi:hypothetical protein
MHHPAALLAAFLAAAMSLGCSDAASPGLGSASFPVDALLTTTSESGAFTLDVRTAPEQPPSRGLLTVDYRIADAHHAPVDGLTLSVVPWMPDMGHGASTTPTVEAMGAGRYVVTNVELFMAGRWDLRTAISGPTEDRAAPTLDIP